MHKGMETEMKGHTSLSLAWATDLICTRYKGADIADGRCAPNDPSGPLCMNTSRGVAAVKSNGVTCCNVDNINSSH
eukprot:6321906-Amphidinium_carterae.1